MQNIENFREKLSREKQRIVITLSTLPDRYKKILKTLQSLKKQTIAIDEIYLSLPEYSVRMKLNYPELPDEIKNLVKVVKIEQDYGPITKLLGALYCEEDSRSIIISCDDDYIYPENFVEKLIEKHILFPNAAIGSSGMLIKKSCPLCAIHPNLSAIQYRIPKIPIPKEGRKVDILYGFSGILYLRGFFPRTEELDMLLKISLSDQDFFLNDDVVISAFLAKHGIERRIFKDIPKAEHVLNEKGIRERSQYELSYNLKEFMIRLNNAIEKIKNQGFFATFEAISVNETVFFKTTLITLTVIVLVFLFFFLLFGPKEALGIVRSNSRKSS
jgi:hypothetical protein